jgi:mannosyltransferase OCH1-like enzyme
MIPKIIIQTYKSEDGLSNDIRKFIKNIKRLNPDFTYMYFDDKDIEIFIKDKFPEYVNKFNSFKYTIQKIDFFRYLAIYYYGGFYFDVDIELYKKLDDLLNYKCIFPIEFDLNTIVYFLSRFRIPDIKKYSGIQTLTEQLGQYAFAAEKNNPFIKKIIDNIMIQLIPDEDIPKTKEEEVCCTTGPRIVTLTYVNYDKKNEITIIKPTKYENMMFGDYGKHHHQGSWK